MPVDKTLTDKPNIVYIFSDQHRGDAMGCVGHPAVITPNLDKLSEEAVTFLSSIRAF